MKILGVKVPSIIADLCKPAQFYLFLSLISVILYMLSMYNIHDTILQAEPNSEGIHQYTYTGLFIKIIFTILWIYILNYICKFKYGKKIAWFIVLLPFFFMGLMLIATMCALSFIAIQTENKKKLQKELNEFKKNNQPQKDKNNLSNSNINNDNFMNNSELLK
jgi:Na+/melibiose symporter-like transporter